MSTQEDNSTTEVDTDRSLRRLLHALPGPAVNITLAASSGALASLAFPPCELWWLAWVCLLPLLIALRRTKVVRASAWLAILFGVVLCTCSISWMATALFGTAAISLFVVASLPWALFGVAYRLLNHHAKPGMVVLMTPVLWIAAEWLRCEGTYCRYSWLQLGFSQVPWSGGMKLYPLVGVYGVTFLIVLVNVILTGVEFSHPRWQKRAMPLGLILIALGLCYARGPRSQVHDRVSGFKACIVQDEVSDLDRLRELTLKWRKERPDLTVWPELAVADYPMAKPELLSQLKKIAQSTRSLLVLGCKEDAPRATPCDWLRRRAMIATEGKLYYNAALVIAPDGKVVGAYHKAHPIQFFSDGVPGRSYPTFETPIGRLGIAICYDFDFASCPLSLVKNGAEALVVPTFDAMEWTALQHTQHSRMAQARAAEVGRWVLRATSSGISQIINNHGGLERQIPTGVSDSVSGQAASLTGTTLYVRALYLLPGVCLWISLVWIAGLTSDLHVFHKSHCR